MFPDATPMGSDLRFQRRNARFWLPALLLGAFAAFALLYWLAPAAYLAFLRFCGIDAYQTPFLDLHGILAALECKRAGIDVLQANPCDALGRPLIYSSLWLAPAAVLPVRANWFILAGLCLDLLFILSLYYLPVVTGPFARTILGLAALSPPTVYALERANADLIIFLMIGAAVPLVLASWPRRIGGYTIFLLAGLLKYYPLALLLILVREKPKRFFLLVAAALLAIASFYFWYRPELIESAATFGRMQFSPYSDSIDFSNLPLGVVDLVSRFSAWPIAGVGPTAVSSIVLALLLADGARRALRINRDAALGAALAELPAAHALFLMLGATVIVACFFAGRSNLYRAVFFLMALPGLLALAQATPHDVSRKWLQPCVGFVLFLMWSEFLRHVLAQWPPGRLAGAIQVLFWVAKELIWWWVIAVFCGLLLQLVGKTPSGHMLTRMIGLGPSRETGE